MSVVRKVKLSITLSADLVRALDRQASAGSGRTRSSVLESWLRSVERSHRARALDQAVAAYYDALDDEARDDDESLSTALTGAARRVRVDPPAVRRRRSA